MKKNKCSHIDEKGMEINTCEDLPVTFCEKCGSFYAVSEDGTRTQIAMNPSQECNEPEMDEALFG